MIRCNSKSQGSLCVSFSRADTGLCLQYLFVWLNLNFLHNSLRITYPTQSCLVLYSFSANLLHSLIMWWDVSSQSPHNLHLPFCCVLSILIYSCFDIVSPMFLSWGFPFFSLVHVFSYKISLVSRLKRLYSCFSSYFSFSGYFCSVDPRVISIVSSGCNQSSSTPFYEVFASFNRCFNAIFNAGHLFSFSLVDFFKFFSGRFQELSLLL